MTIPEGLARLARQMPDVCKALSDNLIAYRRYKIDIYEFSVLSDELSVTYQGENFRGQPALDWLQCALQRVIIAKGYDYQLSAWNGPEVSYIADLWTYSENIQRAGGSPAEALLEALIK